MVRASYAPMSQFELKGREPPRSSLSKGDVPQLLVPPGMTSRAALPVGREWVGPGPPLSASEPRTDVNTVDGVTVRSPVEPLGHPVELPVRL